MIFATSLSPILAYLTPTAGFMYALVIMFAFNIWAGMRADGVSVRHCKNFRFSKFKNALAELLLYVTIIHVIYSVMLQCGDNEAAKVVIKSITYVFMYVLCLPLRGHSRGRSFNVGRKEQRGIGGGARILS